jgi:hypothetical protein
LVGSVDESNLDADFTDSGPHKRPYEQKKGLAESAKPKEVTIGDVKKMIDASCCGGFDTERKAEKRREKQQQIAARKNKGLRNEP